jgi:hypothetical protein
MQSALHICGFHIHGFNQLWIKNIGEKKSGVPTKHKDFSFQHSLSNIAQQLFA